MASVRSLGWEYWSAGAEGCFPHASRALYDASCRNRFGAEASGLGNRTAIGTRRGSFVQRFFRYARLVGAVTRHIVGCLEVGGTDRVFSSERATIKPNDVWRRMKKRIRTIVYRFYSPFPPPPHPTTICRDRSRRTDGPHSWRRRRHRVTRRRWSQTYTLLLCPGNGPSVVVLCARSTHDVPTTFPLPYVCPKCI